MRMRKFVVTVMLGGVAVMGAGAAGTALAADDSAASKVLNEVTFGNSGDMEDLWKALEDADGANDSVGMKVMKETIKSNTVDSDWVKSKSGNKIGEVLKDQNWYSSGPGGQADYSKVTDAVGNPDAYVLGDLIRTNPEKDGVSLAKSGNGSVLKEVGLKGSNPDLKGQAVSGTDIWAKVQELEQSYADTLKKLSPGDGTVKYSGSHDIGNVLDERVKNLEDHATADPKDAGTNPVVDVAYSVTKDGVVYYVADGNSFRKSQTAQLEVPQDVMSLAVSGKWSDGADGSEQDVKVAKAAAAAHKDFRFEVSDYLESVSTNTKVAVVTSGKDDVSVLSYGEADPVKGAGAAAGASKGAVKSKG